MLIGWRATFLCEQMLSFGAQHSGFQAANVHLDLAQLVREIFLSGSQRTQMLKDEAFNVFCHRLLLTAVYASIFSSVTFGLSGCTDVWSAQFLFVFLTKIAQRTHDRIRRGLA